MEEIIKMMVKNFKKELKGDFLTIYDMVSKEARKNAWLTWMKQGIEFAEWELSMSYFEGTSLEDTCRTQYIDFMKRKIREHRSIQR